MSYHNYSMFSLSNNYNYSTGSFSNNYVGNNISLIIENIWGVNNMNNGSNTSTSSVSSGYSAPFYSGYC